MPLAFDYVVEDQYLCILYAYPLYIAWLSLGRNRSRAKNPALKKRKKVENLNILLAPLIDFYRTSWVVSNGS